MATPRSRYHRCLRPGPIPARCSMPACARVGQYRPGARRFVEELVARCRRAGATGEIVAASTRGSGATTRSTPRTPRCLLRWRCERKQGNRNGDHPDRRGAWVAIDYTEDGIAEVPNHLQAKALIVRRTRLVGAQEKPGPSGGTLASSPTWTAEPSTSMPSTGTTPV